MQNLTADELTKLSKIGSTDGEDGVAPTSIFSTIVLSVEYCTPITLATASLTVFISGIIFG